MDVPSKTIGFFQIAGPVTSTVSGGFEYRRNVPRTRSLGGFSHLGSWILGLKRGAPYMAFLA